MGRLKPHHSCLRDDSQVWQPAGLENSVGGLKTKSSRLQNDPMVWHTTGWRAHWDVRKPHHFIHYLPITQTKPYHIMMTSNTRYYIISSSNYTVG